MGFKQIDGNKNILVNENGKVREGLRNIEPDYEYDKDGNIDKDSWPTVVVQSDTEGEDRRLLPAEVLKTHGNLARNGYYTPDMFEAEDGDKTNCSKDNIIFNEDAAKEGPYKEDPKKKKTKKPKPETQKSGKVVEDPTRTNSTQDTNENGDDGVEPEEEEKGNASGNKIVKKSGDYNADEAIAIINNNTLEDLKEVDFYNEDDISKPRTTVVEAWEKKKKQAQS